MNILMVVLTATLAALPSDSAAGTTGPPSPGSSQREASQTPSSEEAIDELGRAVLAALRAGSFEELTDHVVSAEDMGEIWTTAVRLGEITEEQRRELAPQIPAILEETHASLREDFDGIYEKASWKEVSWNEAELAGFQITLRDPMSGEERTVDAATLDVEKAFVADMVLRFIAAGMEHELDLDTCARTSHGWVILERMNWWDS